MISETASNGSKMGLYCLRWQAAKWRGLPMAPLGTLVDLLVFLLLPTQQQ